MAVNGVIMAVITRPNLGSISAFSSSLTPGPAQPAACSLARSIPRVASRFSCNSNHTVWYESIIGRVNQSGFPDLTRSNALASRPP